MTTKQVYFCRHCQSSNNEIYDGVYLQLKYVLSGNQTSVSRWFSVSNIQNLFSYEYDCDITNHGINQIKDIAGQLQSSSLWVGTPPVVVFHSGLKRARETCRRLVNQSPHLTTSSIPIIETPLLNEATLLEHIIYSTLDERIHSFLEMLRLCEAPTVLVVGHGFFFRRMLCKMQLEVRNCDTFSACVRFDSMDSRWMANWESPLLLARTPLSDPALILALLQQSSTNESTNTEAAPSSAADGNTNNNNDDNDECICRICHVSRAELPGLRMIRPCLCSGSLSHVHLKCLNQWRATSSSASDTCSVCKYVYRTRKSRFVVWLFSDYSVIALTAFICLASTALLGLIIQPLAYKILQLDIFLLLSIALQIDPLWRQCGAVSEMITYYHLLSPPLLRAMSTPFTNSISVNWELTRHISHSSFLVKYLIFCHLPIISNLVEIVVIGGVSVGALGILSCVTVDLLDMFNARQINTNSLAFRRLLGIVAWFTSAGATSTNRFLVYLGLLFGAREMYSRVSVMARAATQAIGEQILEHGVAPMGESYVSVVE